MMVIHFNNQLLFKSRGRNFFCRESDLYLGNDASAKKIKILIACVKLSADTYWKDAVRSYNDFKIMD